jgi:hypothetical protein
MTSQTQAEGDLSGLLYTALKAALPGNPNPKDTDEALQRMAKAIGTTVIDYLSAHGQIAVPGITTLPFNGQNVLITWQ